MNLRCRLGFHTWRFTEMGKRRTVDVPGRPPLHVCRLVERCRRCGLHRTNDSAPVPKRVRP